MSTSKPGTASVTTTTTTTTAAPRAQPAAAPAWNGSGPISVQGNLPYSPYGFPRPAPGPPAPLSAMMLQQQQQQQQYFESPTLNSIQNSIESLVNGAGNKLTSHDFVRELGFTESRIQACFPPGQQQLAVHLGMITDSSDKEYRARVTVTQLGFCIVLADTRAQAPYPCSFLYIPYRYMITYVRCKSVPPPKIDPVRPAPRIVPSPFPGPGDAIRLYTSDGRLHVLYRLPVDQLINAFDYWWRLAVGLLQASPVPAQVAAPQPQTVYVVPQGGLVTGNRIGAPGYVVTPTVVQASPAYVQIQPSPAGPTPGQAPMPGRFPAAEDGALLSDVQSEGRILKPSPYAAFAAAPPPAQQPAQQPAHQPRQSSKRFGKKAGYEAVPSGPDEDDGGYAVTPDSNPLHRVDVEMKNIADVTTPGGPLN